MGGNMGGNMNRFDDIGFGFTNEDRRGFALPERLFGNDMGNQGGGLFDSRGSMNNNSFNGSRGNMGGGGGGGGGSSYDRRPMGGGGMDNPGTEMFSRRPQRFLLFLI